MATGQQDDCIWSLVIKKKRVGPLTEQEVRDRFTQGQVTLRTYTWRKGMKKWVRLGNVQEFGDLLLATGESEPTPLPDPEDEPTPVKAKKTATQPMFQITNPDEVDAVTLGAAATMPAGGADTVVDPREREEVSAPEVGAWEGSVPGIPADASVPVVEPVLPQEAAGQEVVELTGGVDPNAATTRWDQDQVDQAISDLTAGEASPEAASSTSQELRLEGEIGELFGREPSVPAVAASVVFDEPHEPEAAAVAAPLTLPPDEDEGYEDDEEEDEGYEDDEEEDEGYEDDDEEEDEGYEDEEDEVEDEDEEEEDEEDEEDDEDEQGDDYEPESEPEREAVDEDDQEDPLAALASQSLGSDSSDDYSVGDGLLGARAKDSVLFSRTQFDTLASSMRGETPPVDDDDEASGLHDIQPLADQALAGARDEDSVLFSRDQLAGMADGLEEAEADDSSSLIDIKPLASTYMIGDMEPDMGPLPTAPPASPLLFVSQEEDKPKHGLGAVMLIVLVGVIVTLIMLGAGLYFLRPDLVKAFFAGPSTEASDKGDTDAANDKPATPAPGTEEPGAGAATESDEPAPDPAPTAKKKNKAPAGKTRGKRLPRKKTAGRPAAAKPSAGTANRAVEPAPRPAPRVAKPVPRAMPKAKPKGDELDRLIDTALDDKKPASKPAEPVRRQTPDPEPADENLPASLDRDQVRDGMKRANIGVQACRGSMANGGTVTIKVTVSGRTGRIITGVALGSWRDTPGGQCVVASAKFAARFPKFSGPDMTFQYPYIIR